MELKKRKKTIVLSMIGSRSCKCVQVYYVTLKSRLSFSVAFFEIETGLWTFFAIANLKLDFGRVSSFKTERLGCSSGGQV